MALEQHRYRLSDLRLPSASYARPGRYPAS
ncbi:hypothetical protein H4W34_004570 [Actinomadura algeriensis]|uniref:Uncharacterized protein n=1 Tax=Actinomadura algeriensis TaxID=1679523 RepID=A0ABR9JVX8_9ACTN|nr:hypothetical protein [Actinomadura algeriensis]